MDIWQYIMLEKIDIPPLYFSHQRRCIDRDGILLAECEHLTLKEGETYEERTVRFRTIGDMTSTGAALSDAATLEDIIEEVASARMTERGGRADDRRSEASMEERKKEGYF